METQIPEVQDVEVQDVEVQESEPNQLLSASASLPWWVVSISFHVLTILLLTLITFASPVLRDEAIIIVTTLEHPKHVETIMDKQQSDSLSTLVSGIDTPPTDPTSAISSDVFVPPEILEKAELGDHWETNNPDKPDNKSAFGTEDAHIFYLESGSDDKAGGGGVGGESFDEIIGIGSSGSPGTGGGWGGGDGEGYGRDKGPGKGSFGTRTGSGRKFMVPRHGGSKATEGSVEKALAWLATHQELDGRWDAKKYESGEKTDTAITGMALLAFLGAGHTDKVGRYKENVKKATVWLRSKQNADGLVFDPTDAGAHRGIGYPHAIAGMALAEAAGMGRNPETITAAQRAIDYTMKHQTGDGYDRRGFRYSAKQAGDLSVTGWFTMQLKSAKVAGLKVETQAFEGVIKFLDSVEMKGAGGDKGYGPASIYKYTQEDAAESRSHRLTAIGNLCRQFMGWKKEDLQSSVNWFVEKGGLPSAWGPEKTDLYYWYYGTLCTFQQGGDVWKSWNEAMKKTFVENQRQGGDENGSWDPVGDYSTEWGRVGQTALSCLCLEVYYRYLPVYK